MNYRFFIPKSTNSVSPVSLNIYCPHQHLPQIPLLLQPPIFSSNLFNSIPSNIYISHPKYNSSKIISMNIPNKNNYVCSSLTTSSSNNLSKYKNKNSKNISKDKLNNNLVPQFHSYNNTGNNHLYPITNNYSFQNISFSIPFSKLGFLSTNIHFDPNKKYRHPSLIIPLKYLINKLSFFFTNNCDHTKPKYISQSVSKSLLLSSSSSSSSLSSLYPSSFSSNFSPLFPVPQSFPKLISPKYSQSIVSLVLEEKAKSMLLKNWYRYKSQSCRNWKNQGKCKFGKMCLYYHGEDDMIKQDWEEIGKNTTIKELFLKYSPTLSSNTFLYSPSSFSSLHLPINIKKTLFENSIVDYSNDSISRKSYNKNNLFLKQMY
jgi:hypothetical protein